MTLARMHSMPSLVWPARAVSLAAGLALAAHANAQSTFQPLVVTGQAAPGAPAGATFAFFSDIRLNSLGQAAFWADLAGAGITDANNGSLWTTRGGTLALVMREGDPSPTEPAQTLVAFPRPSFTDGGLIGVNASLAPVTPTVPIIAAIFGETAPGTFVRYAREGDPAPGLTTSYANLALAPLGPGGQAFNGNKGGGLWSTRTGATTLLAKALDPAPGAAADDLFGHLDLPARDGAGGVVFRASLVKSPAPSTQPSGYGLWTDVGGGPPRNFVLQGQPAAGVPGSNWQSLPIEPEINAGGSVAFWALTLTAGGTGERQGVWSGTPDSLTLVALDDTFAPGTSFDTTFQRFTRHPVIAGNGAVAFSAMLKGTGVDATNNGGIWVRPAGGFLTLVAREGNQAPRLPIGVRFASFNDPLINDAGQIAFIARLTGAGVTGANNVALYTTDRAGRLFPLVRTGDSFDATGAGDFRTVEEIIADSGTPAGGLSAFNPAGALALKLAFIMPAVPPSTAPVRTSGLYIAAAPCLVDINADGLLNVLDFAAFQNAFALADLRKADTSGDGRLDIADFVAFQNAFALGCP